MGNITTKFYYQLQIGWTDGYGARRQMPSTGSLENFSSPI